MSGNNFEQQVKNQLQQLNITPHPDVWNGVEKTLKKKKRRRIIFFWMLNMSLVSGLGILKPWKQESQKDKITSIIVHQKLTKKSFSTDPVKLESSFQQQILPKTANVAEHPKRNMKAGNLKNTESAQNQLIQASEWLQESNDFKKYRPKYIRMTGFIGPKAENPRILSFKDSSIYKKIEKKNMKWGWETGAGSFQIRSGILSQQNAAYAMTPVQGSGMSFAADPINIHPGIYFSTGPWISIPLSNHWSLRPSIQYQFLSNHMNVGKQGGSSLQVSTPNNSRTYTIEKYFTTGNEYSYKIFHHVIEPSLSFELLMGKKKKIKWESGLGLRVNLSDNELSYDQTQQIYYRQSTQFNRVQWFFETGNSFELFRTRQKKGEWGWKFYYDISPYTNNSHLKKLSRMGLGVYLRK